MSPSGTTPTSTRWCPTPEQLMILEELYRSGTRTPNAPQIQRITAHLSLYGKIEGKNVFYWFQNHKARDRQKLRRKLLKQFQDQQQQLVMYNNNHQNHHFFNSNTAYGCCCSMCYFGAPPNSSNSASFDHPLNCHNSSSPANFLFPQGGHEFAPTNVTNYSWKAMNNIPYNKVQSENSMKRMHGHDWMMMMVDMTSPSSSHLPCCSGNSTSSTNTSKNTTTTRPLKTLELFPMKSTNLREESNDSRESI